MSDYPSSRQGPGRDTGTLHASCCRATRQPLDDLTVRSGTGRAGDLVVAEVLRVGAYPALETTDAREVRLRPGTRILGVLGNRFTTTSIYGTVPADGLDTGDGAEADLLAVGGIIGVAASTPAGMGQPTRVRLLGLAYGADGQQLRAQPIRSEAAARVPIILVGGTAAEVGKTTFAANLVNYLSGVCGLRVGVTKLAGTGRLRDLLTLADAGASVALDFVDGGLPTTYGHPDELVTGVARHLVDRLAGDGAEIVVAELGGDLWGAGIPALLHDPALTATARALVVIPSDAMAAYGAATWLQDQNFTVPIAHGVPRRNITAAQERLGTILGEHVFDAMRRTELDAFRERFLAASTAGATSSR